MKFEIEESVVAEEAEARFFEICAFDLAEAGQRKMEEAAMLVREHVQAQMCIQAAVRFYGNPVLTGERLQLDDAVLHCDAFGQIPADTVKGAFVYLLTIGETDIEAEGNIMTELYHDIWGTVYVEAALQELCGDGFADAAKTLYPDQKVYVSQPFGPGYYGMAMEEGRKIYPLVDGAEAGVMQKTSGLLVPEKSCLGLVLVYDRDGIKMSPGCKKCLGVSGGCRFCMKRMKKELE